MKLEVNISKRLGSFRLNVAFTTDKLTTGLLGASGSGKSVTLKCIAGILTPDRGRIVLNGRVLFDSEEHINLKPQERGVGYLFQNYALFPTMSVKKNIYCGLTRTKEKENKKEKYQGILKLLSLEGLENHRPQQLSGGQAQRVALARMLVAEPELLLLDEPFAALDSSLKEHLEKKLLTLVETVGKQVLLVTHDKTEAYRLTEELCILSQGALIRKGSTTEVFQHPQNVPTALLLGERNILTYQRLNEKNIYVPELGRSLQKEGKASSGHIILSDKAISQGGDIPIDHVETLKDLGGCLQILHIGNTSLWWKRQELVLESFHCISIDTMECTFLE